MDKNSLLEKIMPIIDQMTMIQLKMNQLKDKGNQYGKEGYELSINYCSILDELGRVWTAM